MVEGGMDYAICPSRRALENIQVVERARHDLHAIGSESRRFFGRSRERGHAVTGAEKIGDDGGANPTGRSRYENMHGWFLAVQRIRIDSSTSSAKGTDR